MGQSRKVYKGYHRTAKVSLYVVTWGDQNNHKVQLLKRQEKKTLWKNKTKMKEHLH